jgi:hypothetical protein
MGPSGFSLIYQSFIQRIVPKLFLGYKLSCGGPWERGKDEWVVKEDRSLGTLTTKSGEVKRT